MGKKETNKEGVKKSKSKPTSDGLSSIAKTVALAVLNFRISKIHVEVSSWRTTLRMLVTTSFTM